MCVGETSEVVKEAVRQAAPQIRPVEALHIMQHAKGNDFTVFI